MLFLAAVLLVAVAACRSSAPSPPPYATEAGLLARSTCFGVEHLPSDFAVVGRQILDNEGAAQRSGAGITLATLTDWGRLSGAWLQYAYEPPSMPAEDADGFLTQEELEQALAAAHAERRAAPFAAATCRLDLFAAPTGAQAAYQALAATSEGQPLTHQPRGEESRLLLAPASVPGFARVTLWFRIQNVVAAVVVTAACDATQPESCRAAIDRAESLAALLLRRIAFSVPGIEARLDPARATPRAQAERACPERDFTTCVAEIERAIADGQHVTLCVSPYGFWALVPRGAPCPEDDWEPVARFPMDQLSG